MDEAIRAFLDRYDARVRELALAADRVITGRVPALRRELDTSARLIGYALGPGYAGTICTVLLSKTGIKVGIPRGASLLDPEGLLGGSGTVHRSVTIRAVEDLERAAFLALLDAAVARYRDGVPVSRVEGSLRWPPHTSGQPRRDRRCGAGRSFDKLRMTCVGSAAVGEDRSYGERRFASGPSPTLTPYSGSGSE